MLHTHCHMCQEDPRSSVSDTLQICTNHCFSPFIRAISKWHNPSAFYPSRSPVWVIFLLGSVVMFSFSKTWSKNVFYTLSCHCCEPISSYTNWIIWISWGLFFRFLETHWQEFSSCHSSNNNPNPFPEISCADIVPNTWKSYFSAD